MERKLLAAKKLITGLSREEKRWSEDSTKLSKNLINLLGDCLLCSSFLSYAGPFDYTFREKMIYKHWHKDLGERKIPHS